MSRTASRSLRRRTSVLGLSLTAAALLAACSSGSTAAPTSSSAAGSSAAGSSAATSGGTSAGSLTVAMVTPESTGEFYGAMYCGAKAAAKETGVNLNIQGTPDVTVDAEMQVLQSVLATNPDGMLLTVWDNNAFNQTMSAFTSEGKPLIMPDSMLSDDNYLQSIRTDNYQSSYDATTQALNDFGISSGSVLVLTDAPGNAIQTARANGFADAIKAKGGIKLLETQFVGSDSAKAAQAISSAAAANPDLSLVFTTNMGAGTGAAAGVSALGTGTIKHLGYDTASAQVAQLKSGGYDALVAQSPYQMGYDAMEQMSKVLTKQVDPASITDKTVWSPWKLVTKANVDTPEIAPFLYTADCSKM